MESSIDWSLIWSNLQSTMILFLVLALVSVLVTYCALIILGWTERREYWRRLQKRHAEMSRRTGLSDMYCWLKLQRQLENENAPPTMMKVVKECIAECKRREERYLDIYLRTGHKIRLKRNQMEQL